MRNSTTEICELFSIHTDAKYYTMLFLADKKYVHPGYNHWRPYNGGARGVDVIDGGARGVDVIVVGNGHGDTSSNPGRDWLHFT